MPGRGPFPCRSKQTEAKANLKSLVVAEKSHFEKFGKYNSLEKVQFRPRGKKIRYQYELVGFDETSFKARATGTGDMSGDVWFIDQEKNLQHTDDGCYM
ncbi:MAG: hypothetical protein GY822_07625 [Deltaproteobacteria bacterium]|nr:hypothetical protein [Deltaproteobacteria bacterium]